MPRQQTFIRAWREKHRLSQQELAARIGIDRSQLSKVETAKKPYHQDIVEAIARELGIDPYTLLFCDPNDPADVRPIWAAVPEAERARALALLRLFSRQ